MFAAYFLGIIFYPTAVAHAGLFSTLFQFLTGSSETKREFDTTAAVSLPLLGSQPINSLDDDIGGPLEANTVSLPAVQDSALIASRNPIGTIVNFSNDQIVVYTVKPGDTPSSIAANFGISLNTLLWANNLSNPHLIKAGDELIILPVTGVQYEVKKGDNLVSIAKQFKGDVNEISSFNGIAVDEPLQIGTIVIIPDGELIPPVPPRPSIKSSNFAGFSDLKGYFLRPIIGGHKSRGIHGYNGVDLANSCGLPVLAAAEGTVLIARSYGWNGGYGRYLVISHTNNTQTLYAHLQNVLAFVGQKIAQSSQVATIGSTGNSTGCHLHFEVRGAKNPF